MDWSASDVLTAVRSVLASHTPDSWTFEWADLDGGQLLLTFTVDAAAPVRPPYDPGARFAVHCSLTDLPECRRR